MSKVANWLKENKAFVLFIMLMSVFRSAVADWNDVPTGSMKPTIVEGDRIFINKMAYDIRVPFTHTSLVKRAEPSFGDVVIFDSKVSDKRLVKRVIGVPGDTVSMKSNILFVNGKALNYEVVHYENGATDYIEAHGSHRHKVRTTSDDSFSSFQPVVVPDDHYLVLGDNRNNSADSRFIGFVPRNEIVGKSESVAFSLDYDNYFLPRASRFFMALDN
ncbi:signal peptidase I [Thalassotalea euphylliae]|uniref:signal peptidase I n=1 Tax=Thalassotalea euphylliae TaxID=1655234 RepID=UPI0036397DD0